MINAHTLEKFDRHRTYGATVTRACRTAGRDNRGYMEFFDGPGLAIDEENMRAEGRPSNGPEPDGRLAKERARPVCEDDVALCLEEPKRIVRRPHDPGRVAG